jgi:hypothetical protein
MYFFLKVPWSGRPLKRGLASGVDTGGTGSRGQQRVGHGDRASMYVACDPSHRECSTVIIVISRVLGQEMVSETLSNIKLRSHQNIVPHAMKKRCYGDAIIDTERYVQ